MQVPVQHKLPNPLFSEALEFYPGDLVSTFMKILAILQIANFITGHAFKHPYVAHFVGRK